MDAGNTWTPLSLGVSGVISDSIISYNVFEKNDTTFLIFNQSGHLYFFRSINLSNSWTLISNPSTQSINIYIDEFGSANNDLYIRGLYQSNNGSRLYIIAINNGSLTLNYIAGEYFGLFGNMLFKMNEGFTSNNRTFHRSFDLGNTWEECGYGINSPSFSDVCYVYGDENLMVCHVNDKVFASKNRGFSWFNIVGNLSGKKISSVYYKNDTIYAFPVRDSIYILAIQNLEYQTVSGRVYFDYNSNSQYDETIDYGVSNIHVYSESTNGFVITDSVGNYFMYLTHETSNDTVKILCPFLYGNFSPEYYVVHQTDSLKDFILTRCININDLRVDITSQSLPRPGFEYVVNIACKNEGTETLNG